MAQKYSFERAASLRWAAHHRVLSKFRTGTKTQEHSISLWLKIPKNSQRAILLPFLVQIFSPNYFSR